MTTPTPIADADSRRRVGGAELLGSLEANGCHGWRGIRYAAPPVGALRWRAPQAPAPWQGVYEALQHGAMAPQFGGRLAPLPPSQHGQIVGAEDCLSLNIFAPAWAPELVPQGSDRRPVMVWIHGGGNAVGSSAGYDVARNLAAQDGVIVVTVNYRLGVLGWFAHPALQAEPGLSDEERSGNFALLDLIAALHWVREHIGGFGGDPGCVTVFGESAGGQNVLLLLASPLAAGLFHRAIAQSPICESFSMAEAQHGLDSPLESHRCGGLVIAERLLRAAGQDLTPAAMADWLRGLSPAALLAAQVPGSEGIYLGPRPIRDGTVLPLAPLHELFADGHWNRMPVLIGSNRDEYRTFLAGKPEHCWMLAGKLPILRDRKAYLVESGLLSRAWRAHHIDRPADAMLDGGHADVWSYRFDWDEAPALPWIRPDLLLGAAHAMEMPFVFRDEAGEFDLFQVNTPFNRAGRMQLCRDMGTAWAAFARSGEPQLPAVETLWPRRSLQGADSLVLDSQRGGGLRMASLRESLDRIKRELLDAGSGALPAALRLRAFARVFLWSPLFAGQATAAEYEHLRQRLGLAEPASAHRPQMEI